MTHQWTLTPITGTFGAELIGGRIGAPGFEAASLLSLVEEHLLLVLRDQHLTHAEQVEVARALGEPTPAHPVVPGHPDHPEILVLDGAAGGRNARWHTDVTFIPAPPAASVLVGDSFPVAGGDTMWASQYAAYDWLSDPMKQFLEPLTVRHELPGFPDRGTVHPVVIRNPISGRKALFVNKVFSTRILELSKEESDALLAFLAVHTVRPEFICRVRWTPGDVGIWDNHYVQHYAVADYRPHARRIHRIEIVGEPTISAGA